MLQNQVLLNTLLAFSDPSYLLVPELLLLLSAIMLRFSNWSSFFLIIYLFDYWQVFDDEQQFYGKCKTLPWLYLIKYYEIILGIILLFYTFILHYILIK